MVANPSQHPLLLWGIRRVFLIASHTFLGHDSPRGCKNCLILSRSNLQKPSSSQLQSSLALPRYKPWLFRPLHHQYPILVYLYLQSEFPWNQAYLVQKGHNLPQVSFFSNIGCPTPHVVFVNTIEEVVKTPMHDLISKSIGFNVV